MISFIIQADFLLKFSPIWVRKERNDKESMICLTPEPSQSFFVYRKQSKEKKFTEKELFKEKKEWRIEQKINRSRFNCSHYND